MTISSVSTQYLGTATLAAINQSQAQLTRLEVENTTGQYADLGLQLGVRSGYELSLKNEYDQLQTLTTTNSIATTNLTAAQSALDNIRSNAQTTLEGLTTWTAGSSDSSTLQTLGSTSLQTFVGLANTSSGDQYVFGGVNYLTPPLATYTSSPTSSAQAAIDAAFNTTFGFAPTSAQASTITATQLQGFLDGPFAQLFTGSAWTGDWSSASNTDTTAEIAPGETIATSTNANEPGFRQLARAYAMLTEFGGSSLSDSARQVLVSSAATLTNQGIDSMTNTEAQVGSALGQVTAANSSMSSQMTILQTQVGNLDNVDANSVATQLNTLTTQIETAYQLTAQLQKLSLAQYLPV